MFLEVLDTAVGAKLRGTYASRGVSRVVFGVSPNTVISTRLSQTPQLVLT